MQNDNGLNRAVSEWLFKMHSEFMAFVSDEPSAAAVREWAGRQGFAADSVQNGGADLFATLLEAEAPPKLVIVDVDNQTQPVQIAARLVSLCGPDSRLVAIGSANDVAIYRGMIAAGMADYLVKPLTLETLASTMTQVLHGGVNKAPETKEAKIVVMLGVRGGVGVSTLAVNIGWLIAHELKRKCALLDLDMQFGTSALALDLEPGRGLHDIVSSPQRVDSLMVSSALVSESDLFAVLSAEEAIDDVSHVDGSAIVALIKEMKPHYQAVVVELPRHLVSAQKRLLAAADEIVLVTESNLAGIRDTLRVRTMLKSLSATARVTILTTRIGPQRPAAVDDATFAKGAQAKIDFVIPDDHKNVTAASNAGKTLAQIAPSAPVTKVLRQLAEHLLGKPTAAPAAAKKKSGWFGGGKKDEKA